jgi:hypothetical protein
MTKSKTRGILVRVFEVTAALMLVLSLWLLLRPSKVAKFRGAVTLEYPATWVMDSGPHYEALVSLSAPKDGDMDVFQENINIAIHDLAARRTTMQEFSANMIKQIRGSFDNGRVIESKAATIAGVPGYRYSIETEQKERIRILYAWVLKNDKAYTFTFTGLSEDWDAYSPKVEQIIRSLAVP